MNNKKDPYISILNAPDKHYSQHFLIAIDNALKFEPKDRPQSLDVWNQMLREGSFEPRATRLRLGKGRREAPEKPVDRIVEPESSTLEQKHSLDRRLIRVTAFAFAVVLLSLLVGIYLFWQPLLDKIIPKDINAENGARTEDTASLTQQSVDPSVPEDLVNAAMIYAKRACVNYAKAKENRRLIKKYKEVRHRTETEKEKIERATFIAQQQKHIGNFEKNFEDNFSQYSSSIFKLRLYDVESVNRAIQRIMQAPHYRTKEHYPLIAKVMSRHIAAAKVNAEEWRNDLIRISLGSTAAKN